MATEYIGVPWLKVKEVTGGMEITEEEWCATFWSASIPKELSHDPTHNRILECRAPGYTWLREMSYPQVDRFDWRPPQVKKFSQMRINTFILPASTDAPAVLPQPSGIVRSELAGPQAITS
jgi:hypothetical protein